MTSSDLAKPDKNTESTVKRTSKKRNKNILKAGNLHENFSIKDEILKEILHNINI